MSKSELFRVTDKPILPEEVIARVKGDECGAVVTFIGRVRGHSEDKRVLYLEHDASKEMAERRLRDIANEIRERWDLKEVAFCHRTGRIEVGETIMVIAIAAPHRQEAFAACQYAIDRLKQIVPIKEIREGSEVWIGGKG